MKLRVGTSGYGYKEWRGIFYPEKIPPKEMLRFYGERLNAVEINYTFYHMPTEKVLSSWVGQVPEDFAFALKAPRVITHIKRLKDVGEEADYFFTTLSSALGPRLGAVLLQFPPYFHADRERLEGFLTLIPPAIRCAFEFRSPTWREEGIPEILADRDFSLCTADTDEAPIQEIVSTASWGYLRLRRSGYTGEDLSAWLERIRARRWERAFVFFKHVDEARGPGEALNFLDLASNQEITITGES